MVYRRAFWIYVAAQDELGVPKIFLLYLQGTSILDAYFKQANREFSVRRKYILVFA